MLWETSCDPSRAYEAKPSPTSLLWARGGLIKDDRHLPVGHMRCRGPDQRELAGYKDKGERTTKHVWLNHAIIRSSTTEQT